ncbi:nuclear autoantigen Sp-100-like isoform X7 [Peromyscus leucopus]|uniref:nuclear autoantigen Sp-100-like isoform X6 n=1 Tax=Peromyscus leucopus TaxID=10041 RepID=UPI0010A18C35|nr:nuclear autoantigen Sp-100-like isoform X6 [Peromyscus leucopus]XP_037065932.1 nuclear autoantigen Sp-100-like isoform X7 [Peromyscus leucopus]
MSTEQQDPGNFFKHFKAHRVKISIAIKTPFPFFEILRDTELITEKMYDDFTDSCMNRVPVKKVVYRALDVLEKKFDLEVLRVLFSEENMKAYPDLELIARSFENVSQKKLCFHGSDRGYPNSQLCLEQGPGDSCSEESLTLSPAASSSSDGWRNNDRRNTTLIQGNQTENHQSSGFQIDNVFSLVEDLDETVQINGVRGKTTGDDPDGLERHQAARVQGSGSEPEESCELKLNDRHPHLEPHSPLPRNEERAVLLSRGSQTQPSVCLDIKKENSSFSLDGKQQTQARTNHNQASEIIVLSSDDSDDGNNSEEESTSVICQSKPLDSREPHTSRITNKRRGTSNTDSSSTSKRYRRTRHTQDVENNSASREDGGNIRRKRDRHGKYSIRNIKMPLKTNWIKAAFPRRRINSSSRRSSRKRGRRIPRQRNVDFNRPELPVTCGSATGTLYKEKYQQGIHEKSIQSETGQWFTLRQFEIKGGREKSKNWRQSIRCYGWTLKELIKKKHLPDPPRKKRKKENPQNPQRTKKKCTVCCRGWRLCHCATCGKFYHKKCHIPPVEDKSDLWSCVFCKIKNQLKCQENQARYKESEVLKRKMLPEEQLKCELLLLSIYCNSKSRFFIPKPKKRRENFPELREHMWLGKIKYRLNKKAYPSVQHFVEDMRRIFQNHSIIYKNSKFNNLGVAVGSLFEKNFKIIFSINDTSKQPQPCKHTVLLT